MKTKPAKKKFQLCVDPQLHRKVVVACSIMGLPTYAAFYERAATLHLNALSNKSAVLRAAMRGLPK